MYFQRKFLALAFGEPQNLHVTARCFGRDASTVALDNINRDIQNTFHFNVTSRTNKNFTYQVDTSLGICTDTAEIGLRSHRSAVYQTLKIRAVFLKFLLRLHF